MSGSNLHKSEAGWVRLRARVAAREGVRAAKMDHRPQRVSAPASAKPEAADPQLDEDGTPFIVRKGRKRRRAFVAHNGRAE